MACDFENVWAAVNFQSALGYVAGLIDGEGSVSVGVKHRAVRMGNTDLGIIEAYEEALAVLGIQSKRTFKPSPRPEWKPLYIVTIWGRRNLELVLEMVPLRDVGKKAKLKANVESFVLPNYYRHHEVKKEQLEVLIDRGLTQREIASELGLGSHGNAQYYLTKYGLRTHRSRVA